MDNNFGVTVRVCQFIGIMIEKGTRKKIYEHPEVKGYGVQKKGNFYFYKNQNTKEKWKQSKELPLREKYRSATITSHHPTEKSKSIKLHRFRYECIAGIVLPNYKEVVVDHLCSHLGFVNISREKWDDWGFITAERANRHKAIERDYSVIKKTRSKPVEEIDKDGNVLREFPCMKDVHKEYGFDIGNLSQAARLHVGCRGHYFRYKTIERNQDLEGEEWKKHVVTGKKDEKQEISISNKGRIKRKSVDTFSGSDSNSCKRVEIKRRCFSVHKLVAEAWLPPPQNEHQKHIRHVNGDKSDNRVENLEWATFREVSNVKKYRIYSIDGSNEEHVFAGTDTAAEFLNMKRTSISSAIRNNSVMAKKWRVQFAE